MQKQDPKKRTTKSSASYSSQIPVVDWIKKNDLIVGLGIILILVFYHFFPLLFDGKIFVSGDITATNGPKVDLPPEYRLWNPYIWSGMPGSNINFWYNLISIITSYARTIWGAFFEVPYANWLFFVILLGFNTYLLMKHLVNKRAIALFTAISTIFSTGLILYIMIGHVSKMAVIAWFPLVFLIILKLQEKIKLIYFAILSFALTMLFNPWHVQMIYYIYMFIVIYYLYFITSYIINKEKEKLISLIKSGLIFAATTIVALAINSYTYLNLYEYSKYSTRGTKSILEQKIDKISDPKLKEEIKHAEDDQYNYMTNWSFSVEELSTFFIPSFYGFGNNYYEGPLTQGEPTPINTYFGQMPFVDVPQYMGIIVTILALLAFVISWDNKFVRFLAVISVLTLFISFGKNLPIIYNLFYHYAPGFNKFRVPSLILYLLQTVFPILAGFAIYKITIIKENNSNHFIANKKNLLIALSTFGVLFLLTFILQSSFKDSYISFLNSSPKARQFKEIYDHIADMFIADLRISILFLFIAFSLLYLYFENKIKYLLFVALLTFLSFIDLNRIDKRAEHYTEYEDFQNSYDEPDYIKYLRSLPKSEPYRIINIKQDGSLGSLNNNANFHEKYRIEDLYGYSAIKPRLIQDYMDIVSPINETYWKLANVKYIISDKPYRFDHLNVEIADIKAGTVILLNKDFLPRAYFVDTVKFADELDFLYKVKDNTFNPRNVAFIHDKSINLNNIKPTFGKSTVKTISYTPDYRVYKLYAENDNFLFISDTYYPSGWKYILDGKEINVIRTNHAYRGFIIPKGQHTLEMSFAPTSFYVAKYLALILSLMILGIFILKGIKYYKTTKKQ
jgi:hypothetical protein